MNFLRERITAAARPFLSALAALALLATGAIAAEQALADSSGGIGSTTLSDGGSSDGGSADGSSADRPRDRLKAKYKRLWDRVSGRDRRWAHRTAECESGGDPDAIGGGGIYRGAFQFLKSTWRNSPKSPGGDPIDYNFRTQAVVAVALKNRDGAGHWPVCG